MTGARIDEVLTMTRSSTDYYYHYDGLNSVRQITNSSGTIQESYGYDPYGKVIIYDSSLTDITSSGSGIDNPYMYTGRRYDEESEIYFYRARNYDPVIGRFLQRDPIGYANSMNLYEYALSNPINWIDPLGLDVFIFNGDNITLYDDDNKPIKSWPATSGKPGYNSPQYQHIPNTGPIPEGSYSIDPENVDHFNPWDIRDWDWYGQEARDSWGDTRVPIEPDDGTNTHGRDGFFAHGGNVPGSAGCVDLTDYEKDFFDFFLGNYDKPVPFLVDYGK